MTVTSVGLCEEHSGQGQLVVGYWLGGEGHFAKRNLPLGIDHVVTNSLLMKSSHMNGTAHNDVSHVVWGTLSLLDPIQGLTQISNTT